MKNLIALVVLAFLFTGCANTRDPNPVMMKQANDLNLVCHEITVAYESNTEVATSKIDKNNGSSVLIVL